MLGDAIQRLFSCYNQTDEELGTNENLNVTQKNSMVGDEVQVLNQQPSLSNISFDDHCAKNTFDSPNFIKSILDAYQSNEKSKKVDKVSNGIISKGKDKPKRRHDVASCCKDRVSKKLLEKDSELFDQFLLTGNEIGSFDAKKEPRFKSQNETELSLINNVKRIVHGDFEWNPCRGTTSSS